MNFCIISATVHPYLALDFLIGQLLCCHGNSKKRDCISFLIGLIAEDTDDSEVQEYLYHSFRTSVVKISVTAECLSVTQAIDEKPCGGYFIVSQH